MARPALLLAGALVLTAGAGALAGAQLTRDTIVIELGAQRLEAVSEIRMDGTLSAVFAEPTELDLLCGRQSLENVRQARLSAGQLTVTTARGETRRVAAMNCVARLRAPGD